MPTTATAPITRVPVLIFIADTSTQDPTPPDFKIARRDDHLPREPPTLSAGLMADNVLRTVAERVGFYRAKIKKRAKTEKSLLLLPLECWRVSYAFPSSRVKI